MARQLKYDQIVLTLMEYIGRNGLKPGERLPAERKLLPHLDCSMITLRRALTTLAERGVLERRQGDGTFLRQAVGQSVTGGKVLYININVPGMVSPAPSLEYEMLADNLQRHGLEMEYLSVYEFTDRIATASRGAQGILLYGEFQAPFLKSVQALGLPTVLIGGKYRGGRLFPQITLDANLCARKITRYFLQGGARRLVFINSSDNYFMSRELEAGFRQEVKEFPCDGIESDVVAIQDDEPWALDAFLEHIGQYDAIVMEVGNYLKFLAACRRRLQVPATRIGVVPVPSHYRNDLTLKHLFHADRNTVLLTLKENMFQLASERLCGKILHNEPLESCRVAAVIDDGGENG